MTHSNFDSAYFLSSNSNSVFMIFKGSPLTSTIYYGKKLHERGHEISLLISREWADVADYSHLMTNDSFYTTYIFSCGDDFKPLGGGDKVQDADTFFKHFVEFLFDTKMPWFVRPIFHNLFGSLGEYDDDNTAPGYSDTLSRYHQFYQGRGVTRLNRNTRHLRTFDLPV